MKMIKPQDEKQYQIPTMFILPFLLITFGISWGILAFFIFFPEQTSSLVGNITGQHPLFFLAVYAPAIAAFSIISLKKGIHGLGQYLARFLIWRCSIYWYVFLIFGIPLLFVGGAALKGTLWSDPFPFSSLNSMASAVFFAVIKGPVEEFGWRGLALPLLQRKFAPVWAGLILGIIWGFWHLPAFVLSGTQQSSWAFGPFLVGCIMLSIIVTALFNASHGSILLPVLFHFSVMNPVLPDAQPYDTYLLIVTVVVIILLNRKTMFTKENAVTIVIPM